MYGILGIFTYIWLILMVNVGKLHRTWILWESAGVLCILRDWEANKLVASR